VVRKGLLVARLYASSADDKEGGNVLYTNAADETWRESLTYGRGRQGGTKWSRRERQFPPVLFLPLSSAFVRPDSTFILLTLQLCKSPPPPKG
jgi:hypothetical protein